MSSTRPASSHPTGLAAALAVVRLLMALLDRLFSDIADLPASHPDRRLHARVMAELTRVEARLLRDIAAAPAAIVPTRARTRSRATPRQHAG